MKFYNVENILEFNKKYPEHKMKFKILLADEVGFTSPEMTTNKWMKERYKSIQDKITKLAISSRKYGIHMILGLQRPDHKFFPMMAKSQIQGKIAFKTENVGTSRTIIGNDYAYYLPNIPGRMLARYGSTQLEIQGMLLDNDTARDRIVKLPPRKDTGYEVWLQMQRDMEEDEEEDIMPRQRR
jgi:DNA segregation ATPase FtsK/SpoIIIE-like protein